MSAIKSSNNFMSKRILEINRGKNGYGFVLSGQVINNGVFYNYFYLCLLCSNMQ